MTVSPGRGSGEPKAARSALMLPTTATPAAVIHVARAHFSCACSRNRAWNPPTSSSLADDRARLLAPPQHAARDPDARSTTMAERITTVLEPMTAADEVDRSPRSSSDRHAASSGSLTDVHAASPRWWSTRPRLPDGTPFPTMYYLTCPRAVAACSSLESQGLMAEMNQRLQP